MASYLQILNEWANENNISGYADGNSGGNGGGSEYKPIEIKNADGTESGVGKLDLKLTASLSDLFKGGQERRTANAVARYIQDQQAARSYDLAVKAAKQGLAGEIRAEAKAPQPKYVPEAYGLPKNASQAESAYKSAQKDYQEQSKALTKILGETGDSADYGSRLKAAQEETASAKARMEDALSIYQYYGGKADTDGNKRLGLAIKSGAEGTASQLIGTAGNIHEGGTRVAKSQLERDIADLQQQLERAKQNYSETAAKYGGDASNPNVQAAERAMQELVQNISLYQGMLENDSLERTTESLFGKANEMAQKSAQDIYTAKQGANGVQGFLLDATAAGTQMLGDIALGRAIPGAGMLGAIGLRSYGGGVLEARNAGASFGEQMGTGAARATLEMATEKLFDGLAGAAGKGAADDVVHEWIRNAVKNENVRAALLGLYGVSGEAAEEALSSFADPIVKLIYEKDNKSLEHYFGTAEGRKELLADAAHDAKIGGFLGGVGSLASIGTGKMGADLAAMRTADANLGSTASQVNNMWDVLSGRVTAEEAQAREAAALEKSGGQTALEDYARNRAQTAYDNAQAAPTVTPAQQKARETVASVLSGGKVNNTNADYILNDPELRAAAAWQTGINFDGMTRAEARAALQSAARSGAYKSKQFAAQDYAGRAGERAAAAEAQAQAEAEAAQAQAAETARLEEEAARNNEQNYDSYVRGIILNGANRADANEIINNPAMRDAWERLTGKTLPDNPKSALKMITETTRSEVDISVDSAIDRYIAEKNAPPAVEETAEEEAAPETAAETGEAVSGAETPAEATQPVGGTTTAPEEQNASNAPSREFNSGQNAEGQPASGDATLTPTETTTAESTNGTGRERERGGATNVRTNENAEQDLRQDFENIPDKYRQLTNKEVQDKAEGILAKGFEAAKKEVTEAVGKAKAGMKLLPEHFVAGFQIANELARRGEVKAGRELMSDLIAEQTAAGQLGQIGRLVRQAIAESDAATRMMAIQKLVGKLNQQLTKGQMRKNVLRGEGDEGGMVKVNDDLLNAYANAQGAEATNDALEAIKKDLARQIPATFADKFTALRYLNMLGNFKTQERNLLGNLAMMAATNVKYTAQASLEGLVHAVNKNYQRNTSLFAGRDLIRQADDVFKANMEEISGEGKFDDAGKQIAKDIKDEQKVFGTLVAPEWSGNFGKVLANAWNKYPGAGIEAYRKATKWAMEAGDTLFMRPVFNRSYAGWMKAHGVTDISQATAEQKAAAFDFAAKEAQEATFHDRNAFSDAIAGFGRGPNAGPFMRILSEGVLPFRRTPANVAVRAFEYSPLGLFKSLLIDTARGKSGADVINGIAKGATGTSLFALGMLLQAAGKARAHGDDDDKKLDYFHQQQGAMDYSVNVLGQNISLSQMAPMAVPFFMGVAMGEEKQRMDGEAFSADQFLQVLGAMSEPMLEMSMLSGVNDLLKDVASLDGNAGGLGQLILNASMGYLSQGLTNTLLGQAEQGSEENRQTVYADKKSADATGFDKAITSGMQKKLGKYAAKTPGIDYHQQDYVDAWGRKQSNGDSVLGRYANAFLNPTYISKDRSEDVDAEIERLHTALKDVEDAPEVIPQARGRNETIGDGVVMTPSEYEQFAVESGQKKLELVRDFMQSEQYKSMTGLQRGKAISELYSLAENLALDKIKDNYGIEHDHSYDKLLEGSYEVDGEVDTPALKEENLGEYLAFHAAANLAQNSRDYDSLEALYSNFENLDENTKEVLAVKDPYAKVLTGVVKPGNGEENDIPALENVADLPEYARYSDAFGDAVRDLDYDSIDSIVKEFGGLNENLQAVLAAKSRDGGQSTLNHLLDYAGIGVGSRDYFELKDSTNDAQDSMDRSSNQSGAVKLQGLADADIPDEEKDKIVESGVFDLSKAATETYKLLRNRGYDPAFIAEWFDNADWYGAGAYKGEPPKEPKADGSLNAYEVAVGISKIPGLSGSDRDYLYRAFKAVLQNPNDLYDTWKKKSYTQILGASTNNGKTVGRPPKTEEED